jgi:hypothetical protein
MRTRQVYVHPQCHDPSCVDDQSGSDRVFNGLTELYVHHNIMTLRSSTTEVGAVAFNGLVELYSADNRFDHSVYGGGSGTAQTGHGTTRPSRGVNGKRRNRT